MNGYSEADALNDLADESFGFGAQSDERIEESLHILLMRQRYVAAKKAKTGSLAECATCGRKFIKRRKHQAFCSNGWTRKGGNCKDRYHNTINAKRRERAMAFNRK